MPGTVLVTGATAGFGWAVAEKYAADGWKIVAVGRRMERLDALKSELGGASVHAVQLDVRDKAAVEALPEALPAEFAEVDILVNNAGLALGLEPAHKTDIADWETMIDTNITGLARLTRAVLPGMVERDRGHIVNLGSIAGAYPYPGGNVYGATKAFVKQFSLNLRADLLGTKVRVTNIEPGMAETEFSVVRFKGDKASADKVYTKMTPLYAADIADIIHWTTSAPWHVNINSVEVMPTQQAFAMFAVDRGE